MFILHLSVLYCIKTAEQRIYNLKTKLCKAVNNFHVDEDHVAYIENCAQVEIARELLVRYQTECSLLKLNLWNGVNEWKNAVGSYVAEVAKEFKTNVAKWKEECMGGVIRSALCEERKESVGIKNARPILGNKNVMCRGGEVSDTNMRGPDKSVGTHGNEGYKFTSRSTKTNIENNNGKLMNIIAIVNEFFTFNRDIETIVNTYLEKLYRNVYDQTNRLFDKNDLLGGQMLSIVSKDFGKYFLPTAANKTFVKRLPTHLKYSICSKLRKYEKMYNEMIEMVNSSVANFVRTSLYELYEKYIIEIEEYRSRLNESLYEIFLNNKKKILDQYERLEIEFCKCFIQWYSI
ncbi:hypothetical protein VCUG_00989 [Vavraia culicis subsp. floridensis]|uniref:Uncharacterized protein n=1 Tax=Vavraia culicis (isolate floridensis) TaxID=948595 RepID=L2GW83_VAVCU|nr:uncharacterized protein VCUG_00989 [Vavraia culicis subsp. floridensis]ELA47558.1 hypothetical protein VCUG_00989 [Vavraia culicis subsp. floridensis]